MYRKKLSLDRPQEIDALIGTLVRIESTNSDATAGIITKRAGCDLYWTNANGSVDSRCLQNAVYVTTLDDSVEESTEPSLRSWLGHPGIHRRVEYRGVPMGVDSPLITWARAQVDNFTSFSLDDGDPF